MEPFSIFDPLQAGSLVVIKKGLLQPEFTLADEFRSYGEMSYPGNQQIIAAINSAQHSWTMQRGNTRSWDIFINDAATGQNIAVIKTSFWLARITIHFADGEVFRFIRPTVFSRKQRWRNDQYGDVLTTKIGLFSFKQRFGVIPAQGTFKNGDYLMLMIFSTVHLVLMRRVYAGTIRD